MQIFKADSNSFSTIEAFLKDYEYICVSLCAKIRKQEDDIFVISSANSLNDISKENISGIFSLDNSLMHCIPNPSQDVLETFKIFIKDKKIKTISGQSSTTDLLIQALEEKQNPAQVNKYKLMVLNKVAKQPPEELSCDDQIIRCTEDNLEILMDLQKQYLIKEVAPAGKQVTDLECRISLRQVLKNQLMFALYADTELVAKANTNAIGWNHVQIGGVFTHPLYRRNYYAWHLLKLLCDRIQKTGKTVCLFVKEKNIPAIKLYENIGFSEVESYAIAYY